MLKTINAHKINVNGSTHIQQYQSYSNSRYSQRHSDNTKRPKSKENQLGILKIHTYCQKIQQRASGLGESTAGVTYLSMRKHPKSCVIFPPKS